ncbi:MAG: NAD(P)-binding domain-containing protein [Brevundimonas sp.]|uniref:Shikimate dehydrogenase (NADP(+)) n=1 Tax=Brevundimonas albigilva TaxID=1312364 RepID=A0ABY4SK61_9CAUL|nr:MULTISPECIES: NAD(P)-binding domain-containing protein [Brevundimonas]MCV0414518.1 NAD(P)-binding domain-containing protein [Brevundimonas sp.]URI15092.1 NAD(P)-binding domain-containing protein [Brevundimonas albigilva]
MRAGRITGAAVTGGIAGNPVAHSLSPIIHNAWLEAGGIDAAYLPFAPRDAAGFEALVAAGRAGMLAGLNVTAPFKEQAFALADQATAAARLTRSANILRFVEGQVLADSSDGIGLMRGLAEQAPGLDVAGRPVVLLGAGGAARAGAGALVEAGAEVRIVNRSPDRAEALAADLGPSVRVMSGQAAADGAALVVNALSVPPDFDLTRLPAEAAVMDMTYKPLDTAFLKAARARGLATVDGLSMLIGQAAPSFEAIFGRAPPPLDLRALLTAHLEARA